ARYARAHLLQALRTVCLAERFPCERARHGIRVREDAASNDVVPRGMQLEEKKSSRRERTKNRLAGRRPEIDLVEIVLAPKVFKPIAVRYRNNKIDAPCHPPLSRLPKPLRTPRLRLRGLGLTVARRGIADEIGQEAMRGVGHLGHGAVERFLVRLRRPVEATQLADELQGRGTNLVVRRRRCKVCQRPDVAAHGGRLLKRRPQASKCRGASSPGLEAAAAALTSPAQEGSTATRQQISRRYPRRFVRPVKGLGPHSANRTAFFGSTRRIVNSAGTRYTGSTWFLRPVRRSAPVDTTRRNARRTYRKPSDTLMPSYSPRRPRMCDGAISVVRKLPK